MTRTRPRQQDPPKPKMTKEERRDKYTKLARDRKDRSIARAVSRTQTCFACRQRGHSLAFCPNNNNTNGGGNNVASHGKSTSTICYKCGSEQHALSSCPSYNSSSGDTDLPFAVCFVCNDKGHLASQCSQNEKGVFPNGGECKRCGSNRHVSSKCPDKLDKKRRNESSNDEDDFDASDLLEGKYEQLNRDTVRNKDGKAADAASAKKKRVVNF